ncbi:MAG: TIGR03617 family F420-dependent LLM class oxidoreductase [Myxococcales bacterium]|nr:TIGR03617 family F420-dependent LLM class oxidoreductase [Myxococcales bacterium]
MKLHGSVFGDLAGVPERARRAEADGYDGVVSAEISNDPFLPLALAAEHTEHIELVTAIAVAFSRNPMTLAQLGHDLNAYSKGRFVLGLGSQIKPHITKRFSMPWSKPAARMREFVLAMRAIWNTWHTGAPLEFRGEFYSHTLMTPMFVPANVEYGAPRVVVAAVGNLMTEAAGEVADGLLAHAFTTPRYLREVTLPALERGLAKAGRKREDIEVICPAFVASGETDEAFEASRNALRQQIAFYASTPAYRPVLELHGWEFGPELTALSKQGKWVEMGQRIDDEVLETFAVVAAPEDVGAELARRYAGALDTWIATFQPANPDTRAALFAALRA